jgi:hypothetical protein
LLATTPTTTLRMAVYAEGRAVDVGRRIAALRNKRNKAQMQLAAQLGVAQETLAHHKVGRLRLLTGALPELAKQLGFRVEDLIGLRPKRSTGKRGPAPKPQQRLERIQSLPKALQKAIA